MEQERREIVQDVIDRLIYLRADKLQMYKNELQNMHSQFSLKVVNNIGVRVYEETVEIHNLTVEKL